MAFTFTFVLTGMARYHAPRSVTAGTTTDHVFIKSSSITAIITWSKRNTVPRGNNLKKPKWVDFVLLCIIRRIVNDHSGSIRPGLSGKHTYTQLHPVKGQDITMTIVKSKWREFGWHPDYTDSRTFNDVIYMYGALIGSDVYIFIYINIRDISNYTEAYICM